MGQLIARNQDDRRIESLEDHASRRERAEAGRVVAIDEARERAERISRSLEGRPYGDGAALIREDRGR